MRDLSHPILALTTWRMRAFVRDPGSLFWTFGFPLLLAMVLGFAFREGTPMHLRAAVICQPDCPALRMRIAESIHAPVSERTLPEALTDLQRSKLDLVVEQVDGSTRYHYDATRTEGRVALLAAKAAHSEPNTSQIRELPMQAAGATYIDFLLPGLLGVNLLSSSVWGVSFWVVEARRGRLLKQLSTTPVRKLDYLLAVLLSRLLFFALEVAAILGFGALAFDTVVRGSHLGVLTVALAATTAFTALALWVSARASTTEAIAGWSNLVVLPMWLLSGVFFSYERFPEWSWSLLRALPLTAANDAFRALINEGSTLAACLPQLSVLAAWSVIGFALTSARFRWQ